MAAAVLGVVLAARTGVTTPAPAPTASARVGVVRLRRLQRVHAEGGSGRDCQSEEGGKRHEDREAGVRWWDTSEMVVAVAVAVLRVENNCSSASQRDGLQALLRFVLLLRLRSVEASGWILNVLRGPGCTVGAPSIVHTALRVEARRTFYMVQVGCRSNRKLLGVYRSLRGQYRSSFCLDQISNVRLNQ